MYFNMIYCSVFSRLVSAESETTYDEFRDSPSLPPRDLDKGRWKTHIEILRALIVISPGGEVLDNTSREDHTSLQIPADNGTNAGSAEVEQLQGKLSSVL